MASAIPTKKAFKSGEVIMRQGDPGESAYIIESGRVEILVTGRNGKVQNVGTRGAGTMIGEMALVDNAPRTATVQAVENCVLLEITKEDFSNRLQKADPILRMTSQVILTRYRDTLTRAEISNESSGWPPVEAQELTYAGQTDAIESVKIANDFRTALEKNSSRCITSRSLICKKARFRASRPSCAGTIPSAAISLPAFSSLSPSNPV
jgi:CRP-like cAMP-binding protein